MTGLTPRTPRRLNVLISESSIRDLVERLEEKVLGLREADKTGGGSHERAANKVGSVSRPISVQGRRIKGARDWG